MVRRETVRSDALYPEPHALSGERLTVLDGWRAISILAVLAGHWLPLDSLFPGANDGVPAGGMAIFFTLSGFLITRFLLGRPEAIPFLIRRLLRIVPLAWLAMLILYFFFQAPANAENRLVGNLFFFANLPPQRLFDAGGHLWSLCVEMQFYVSAALLVAIGGRSSLRVLPFVGVAVTILRIVNGATINIVTWYRIDEILAGATLALIYGGEFGQAPKAFLARCNFWLLAAIAAVCSYFIWHFPAYGRPYAVAALVGVTLFRSPAPVHKFLTSRPAAYIAEISYALYVIHGILTHTWLGSGDAGEKYLKRPLIIAVTFALAHLSTYHFEKHFIALAKRLTARPRSRAAPEPVGGAVLAAKVEE